jgi:CelD/BcsL family acetyltransferase involved in cellulose biosynthesis
MIRTYVLTTEDAARWRAALPAAMSVMGSVEYARICEKQTGCPARLFVAEAGGCVVAYPYLMRAVRGLPFANGLGESRWDTFTPEYSGPLCVGPGAGAGASARFADLFARHCQEQRIVAEFVHLNPWNDSAALLEPSAVEPNRDIVYVDLTWDEDEIWNRSLTSDGRRQTKQAQRAGVQVRRAESVEDVCAFQRLHKRTMERRGALDKYHLPAEYFLQFFNAMPENSFFVLAEHEGRVVAGGLYLQDRTNIYWHLSAADEEFLRLRPVNGYLYETIRWALRQGQKRMLLGGGYKPDDGVFRFKTNFSPLRARFCTYKRVHDPGTYDALTRACSAYYAGQAPRTDFFPAYRATCGA